MALAYEPHALLTREMLRVQDRTVGALNQDGVRRAATGGFPDAVRRLFSWPDELHLANGINRERARRKRRAISHTDARVSVEEDNEVVGSIGS